MSLLMRNCPFRKMLRRFTPTALSLRVIIIHAVKKDHLPGRDDKVEMTEPNA
jgi:hypothetical protein